MSEEGVASIDLIRKKYKKPIWIVIDKDFLQDDRGGLNKIIAEGFRLLLTARIAYEIQTTDKQDVRTKCLRVLNDFKDNVDIVDEDGNDGLLGYEMNNKKPSGDVLQDYIRPLPHNLDQFLRDINIPQWKEDFENGPADEFKSMALETIRRDPSLSKNDLKDRSKVQNKLTQILPQFPLFDERWIIFRRWQVDYWMDLDRANVNDKNRLHDRIDSRVTDVALLTKGLASNDRLVKNIFKFFCPEGKLFSTAS